MISVLLVDDEESLLDLGTRFLYNREHLLIQPASSAQKACEILERSSFDAIVSDYDMPEMNGIAFLKTIRSEYDDVPFILFTGKGREEIVIDAINNGADFYVQKGGDPKTQFAELAHKIRQAVDKHQAHITIKEKTETIARIAEETLNFISLHNRDDIITHLGKTLEDCIKNSIIITTPSLPGNRIRVHSIHGIDPKTMDIVHKILGDRILNREFTVTDDFKPIFHAGRLFKHPETIARFATGIIPEKICHALQELFHISHLYSIGLTTGIADGGSVHIFCRDDDYIRNPEAVEALVFQASLALERVHTAELIKKRESDYEKIFNQIQEAYYRTTIDGHLIMVNPSGPRMLGYNSVEEVLGMSVDHLWVDPSELERKRMILKENGNVNDFKAQMFHKDGTIRDVTFTSHLLYDSQGTIIGTEGVIHDITDKRE